MGGFASLGSGSRGNGTLVAIGDAIFLVDCGFNRKQAEQRLARLEMSPGDITAILVSHEHSDHIAGVAGLSHRYAIPVYASHGTLKNSPQDFQCNAFDGDAPFEVEGVLVNPVRVPHDAREPTQFVLSQTTANATSKIGVLSDLGSVTPHVVKQFEDVSEGDYGFTAEVGGDYKACFFAAQIPAEDRAKHRVSLEWKSGVAATTWGKIAKETDVDVFTKSLRRLEADLIEVHETMLELRKLEADMRDKNEATNSRVVWMGLISLVVCVGLAFWQIFYLKAFFKRKKVL
jgi:hypothetical protein